MMDPHVAHFFRLLKNLKDLNIYLFSIQVFWYNLNWYIALVQFETIYSQAHSDMYKYIKKEWIDSNYCNWQIFRNICQNISKTL